MNFNQGITIIGSGNVAWHLGHLFSLNGIPINSIFSRNQRSGKELASKLNVPFLNHLSDIPVATDLILLCVSDGAISEVAGNINPKNTSIAHTAGSISLSELSDRFSNSGVFYPFQSFTKGIPSLDKDFPICIESNSAVTKSFLETLARGISSNVVFLNSEQRKDLHQAGVIANNFTNHLFTEAFDFLAKRGIDSSLLIPIIKQTAEKLNYSEPKNLQTGPAVRGSTEIIKNHIEMLDSNKDLQDIYRIISDKILQYHKKNNE